MVYSEFGIRDYNGSMASWVSDIFDADIDRRCDSCNLLYREGMDDLGAVEG